MELKHILEYLQPVYTYGNLSDQLNCENVAIDSRKVRFGSVFVALPSVWPEKPGGEQFIPQAIKAGAKLIVTDQSIPDNISGDIVWVQVSNPHRAVSALAKAFYPHQPSTLVAVTGTNGKSSVVDFTYQLWRNIGLKSGKMGTIAVEDSLGSLYPGFKGMTTPDALTLHENLNAMATNGIDYAAMEASSHALQQYRMDEVKVNVAAFTNLTHEHLDYHKDIDSYFKAKARLFDELLENDGIAVLNHDDAYCAQLREILDRRSIRQLTYGHKTGDVRYSVAERDIHGQVIDMHVFDHHKVIQVPLIGDFQVTNVICALVNAIATGVNLEKAVASIPFLHSVPGRLQRVHPQVYVDYAHTPDALATVLKAIRPHVEGKLHVVFGAGGNRDASKRPLMGKVAHQLADIVYITDDNPRFESALDIRKEILSACPGSRDYEGREYAIEAAVNALGPKDVLLIAGKGHETGQIIGDRVIPFNDVEVAQRILKIGNDDVEKSAN